MVGRTIVRKLALAAMLLLSSLVSVPAQAAGQSENVALGADVTLRGDAFFTAGWGGGMIVPPASAVDGEFLPKGTQWDQGAVWWDENDGRRGEIVIDLGGRCRIESLVVQADDNDAYSIRYESPRGWRTAWEVPNYDALGVGMLTRPDPDDNAVVHVLRRPIVATRLAVQAVPAASNDLFFSVSEVQAFGNCR